MKKDLNKRTLADLNQTIEDTLDSGGPYSHNIIALVLQEIDKRFGKDEANKSIELHGLDLIGWSKQK